MSALDTNRELPPELQLDYLPRNPRSFRPKIALIGCGGITGDHLKAYRAAGWNVATLCDLDESKARQRQAEFYPQARIETDFHRVFEDPDIEVVDIATHTSVRRPIIEAAIRAGKHVLSQKPFVLNLDEGERLVELAREHRVKLAVNQNGRFAPHFSYARAAVKQDLLGSLMSINISIFWDHTWVKGTAFEQMRHLILYDYAIHWFDFVSHLFGDEAPERVTATTRKTSTQTIMPPLLAGALIECPNATALLSFAAETHYLAEDRTFIAGSRGSILSRGPNEKEQRLTIATDAGCFEPVLEGSWFPDAFRGTMGELLCSIEEDRPCELDAAENLKSLELCFAAIASAESGRPVEVGAIRRLDPSWL